MSERLTWLCFLTVVLTVMTLIESVRDLRAVRRRRENRKLQEMAIHSIVIESLRVLKGTALGMGVLLAHPSFASPNIPLVRSSIMAGVAIAMGLTSSVELVFRHRFAKKLLAELKREENASEQ